MVSKAVIQKGSPVHAVLVNSGNANACTGEKGFEHALATQTLTAEALGILPDAVLVSSTGVIGQFLPMEAMQKGITDIIPRLCARGGNDAAQAIMTTDTRQKSFAVKISLSKGDVHIGAIAKGSGMIMPNMATMLCFLTTDAAIAREDLQRGLTETVNGSFNKITVDGDTSTNDMVTLLANGASGITIQRNTADYDAFMHGLIAICQAAAKAIIVDGEGATKLVTVHIKGARTSEEADAVGKSVANSPLVKTAIHGEDANWGRIICAAGYSGADIDPEKISIFFDDLPILEQGFHIALDEEKAKVILSKDQLTLTINLGMGDQTATWWTCDLSAEYIRINAAYRT